MSVTHTKRQIHKWLLTITQTENGVRCENRSIKARNDSVFGNRASLLGGTCSRFCNGFVNELLLCF